LDISFTHMCAIVELEMTAYSTLCIVGVGGRMVNILI